MSRPHALAAWAVAVGVLVGAGCTASDDTPAGRGASAPEAEAPPAARPGDAGTPVAEAIAPLPPATPVPTVAKVPAPSTLVVEALDVRGAPVVPVAVESNGEMEIPGASQVGWYRYGPRPGDDGSAVLAAHVAYDGVDGGFRHLGDLAPGNGVTVGFADGTARAFAVTEVARYDKAALPEDIWARGGTARLVLITCGGEFDAAAGSYEDNVVAFATPT